MGPYFLSFSGFSEKTKKYERRVNERTHGGFSVRDYFILCSSYSICQDYSIKPQCVEHSSEGKNEKYSGLL